MSAAVTPSMEKVYAPHEIERRIYQRWESHGWFAPAGRGQPYCIVIPPPNVTGTLHMGHAFQHTLMDVLTRYHRMRGYDTLWQPGTDHAGIATQMVVERQLNAQGQKRTDLSREAFVERIWQWKQQSGNTIASQMRRLGDSVDWSRDRFTMDPALSRAVTEVFVRLHEEGLIYRGKRLVNWDPVLLTAVSDLEVESEEEEGHLWHLCYPLEDSSGQVVVATTRPETMLGDAAVAVNPEDERYRHLIGKRVLLPLMEREIPVISDEMVDREFGTGAVKITPAHDPNDFEVGRRHHLPEIDVMTNDGHMSAAAGAYAGLDRFAARKKIVEDLRARGLLEKVTEHTHAVGICERSRTIVEPRASTQWFCKMKPLAEPAIAAVESGDIQIVPENRRQEYFNWMRNIRDWTLSRQLWWGHRIPAWYCEDCKQVNVAVDDPAKCMKCGSPKLTQDPDVLDTWFSSGLWPFSTLGWPDDTPDYRRYYPTTLLITGYDILFFWVARMIMLGLHFTHSVPFRAVYLHSLVRTAGGEKMSKSKGTGLDPVALNQQYGTDAMRFCLASMAAPGTDIVLSDDRLASARNFANKIWNASRFLFVNLDKFEQGGTSLDELAAPQIRTKAPYASGEGLARIDGWLFSRLAETISSVNEALQNYRFHEAAQSVYQFFWGDFCDWYIEWVKPDLQSAQRERAVAAWRNLFAALDAALRLLQPFMPFITEELWHQLPQRPEAKSIALDSFPVSRTEWKNPQALERFSLVQEVIVALRNIRAEMKLEPKKKIEAEFSSADEQTRKTIEAGREGIIRLAALSELRVSTERLPQSGGSVRSTALLDVRIPYVAETIDVAAEAARLRKQIEGSEKAIAAKEKQLADEVFRSRAPEKVVRGLEATLAEQTTELQKLRSRLEELKTAA